MSHDVAYLLERSEVEAIRSIEALNPTVAAVHQEMCLLYTARALAAMVRRRG